MENRVTFDGPQTQFTSSETPDCTLLLHQRYGCGLKKTTKLRHRGLFQSSNQ